MTRTARNNPAWCLLLLTLLGPTWSPAGAAAQEPTLFAFGANALAGEPSSSANPVWLASTETHSGSEATSFYLREKVGDSTWLELAPFKGKVLGITGQQGEVVVLIKRSSPNAWLWMSTISAGAGVRSSYGPALPERMEFVTLAGDRRALWALGRTPIAPPPTTTRAVFTTMPLSRWRVQLFQLNGETWTPLNADWPADVMPVATEDISMCVVNDRPTVAVPLGGNIVHVLQYQDGKWARLHRRVTGPKPRRIKLLALQDRPVVWVQPEGPNDAGGRIWIDGDHEFNLSIPEPQPKPEDVAVTVAGDNVIRLFWRAQKDKKEAIYELRFNSEGEHIGKPVEVIASRPRSNQMQWAMVVVAAIAAILVLNFVLRRRAAMRNANPDDEDRSDLDE